MVSTLFFSAQCTRASATDLTITFFENSGDPTVSTFGDTSRILSSSCTAGSDAGCDLVVSNQVFSPLGVYIGEPDGRTVSDTINLFAIGSPTYELVFVPQNGSPCACTLIEDGTIQTVFTVNGPSGTDTIKFQSDDLALTPEPSTFFLYGIGLLAIIGAFRWKSIV